MIGSIYDQKECTNLMFKLWATFSYYVTQYLRDVYVSLDILKYLAMLQGIFMAILGGVKLSYRILSEPCPKPYCFSSLLSKVSYATKLMGSNYKSSMYRYHFLSWSFYEKQLLFCWIQIFWHQDITTFYATLISNIKCLTPCVLNIHLFLLICRFFICEFACSPKFLIIPKSILL